MLLKVLLVDLSGSFISVYLSQTKNHNKIKTIRLLFLRNPAKKKTFKVPGWLKISASLKE